MVTKTTRTRDIAKFKALVMVTVSIIAIYEILGYVSYIILSHALPVVIDTFQIKGTNLHYAALGIATLVDIALLQIILIPTYKLRYLYNQFANLCVSHKSRKVFGRFTNSKNHYDQQAKNICDIIRSKSRNSSTTHKSDSVDSNVDE